MLYVVLYIIFGIMTGAVCYIMDVFEVRTLKLDLFTLYLLMIMVVFWPPFFIGILCFWFESLVRRLMRKNE